MKEIDEVSMTKPWFADPTHSISVLLPTRKRTELLKKSLESLFETADDPSNIELFLGFDNDDKETLEWAKENIMPYLEEKHIDAAIVEFTPMGYERLNDYLNAMAGVANGRWLFFWNDDAVMETQGWDSKIREHDGRFVVQRVLTHNSHPYSIFPILPRDWYYLLGYLSRHQLNDAYISQIAYMLDIMQTIDVNVVHDRADLTGNNRDETYQRRMIFEGRPDHPKDFNHISNRGLRIKDANKIAWYLKNIGQPSVWFEAVIKGKQDPWEKMLNDENDPNNQVRIYA